MMSRHPLAACAAALLCLPHIVSAQGTATASTRGLKDAFKEAFLVGTALAPQQFSERDTASVALIKREFNAVTPENVLKWERVHPEPTRYDFDPVDQFVSFGEKHGMFIVGHTLVWHSQTPRGVFENAQGQPLSREALLARMKEHISTVVGRYKGRVKGWDVVNEALNEDGTLRQSPWLKIIGEDYIAKAFQYAREADPNAELYYNDYSLENEPKRRGAIALVKKLQKQGVPITAAGLQGHNNLTFPTLAQIEATIT